MNLSSPVQTANPSAGTAEPPTSLKRDLGLAVGALGVVFGDIGTSPLYAMRGTVQAAGGNFPAAAAIYGSVSLIFWALVIVVTIKYVVFIMRADNNGEGGILALAALAHRAPVSRGIKTAIGVAALLGLALFYGDGMLTPAVSVLSAMEGLSADGSAFTPLVLPLTIFILLGLFLLQRRGTGKIGNLFGPIMMLWFLVIAAEGVVAILKTPQILFALNPLYGASLFQHEPWIAFVTLGLVVLAVTGCEALYADMGHFGKRAIRWAWLYCAFPALVLNYVGQGALLLTEPKAAPFLFYALAPSWAHYPMVILATVATSIASQAVISGVFSITRQAVQLGQLPRMEIRHTSAVERGQIYVPRINVLLSVGVILIVLIFKSSDALMTAYGIAVTGVMVISTVLVAVVAYHRWGWPKWAVFGVFGALGLVDLAFLASNSLKIVQGGWLPLVVAAAVFVVMDTWRVGRRLYMEKVREGSLSLDLFLERADKMTQRVAGTAVFMSARSDMVPGALLHSLKHFKVMHERVVLATVTAADTPFVPASRRIAVEKLGKGFFITRLVYGFFESPDIPQDLALARAHGLALEMDQSTFFLGRETLVPGEHPSLSRWRVALYMWLASNAQAPARFYHLPPGRVVELGTQVTI
ncbi:MAG TPA: potassium transporter Kup [Rhizomicrobium sp.]|nr:potassium transporter Kup [Rhizomicrobium sp.]